MDRLWSHVTHRTVTRGPRVDAASDMVSCGPSQTPSARVAWTNSTYGKSSRWPSSQTTRNRAGTHARLLATRMRRLPQAVRVHVLGQVRAPSPAVDQLELAGRVQRAEPVAARAAHPPRERRHRHAGTRERVVVGVRIPRRVPQRPDLRSEYPLHRLQQARLVDRILVLGVPRVQAAHDHAHRRQVDGRAHPGGGDEVARPRLPDPGGSTALPGTGRNAGRGSRRNGHAGPPEVERS